MILFPLRSIIRILSGRATCLDWVFGLFAMGAAVVFVIGGISYSGGQAAENDYFDSLDSIASNENIARSAVTAVSHEIVAKPRLLLDSGWHDRLRTAALGLTYAYDHMILIHPPEKYSAFHVEIMTWAREWKNASDQLVLFANTSDSSYLDAAQTHTDLASAALNRADLIEGLPTPTPFR